MSRPLRIEYPNAWYHVMNRGRRGEKIFESKRDYDLFLEVMLEAVELFSMRVSAYCLLPNHYHLLVQTPDANLSRCMRHINGVYTQRFNRQNAYDGQLFRGRYKAIVVSEDAYLLQLVRYIHLNPVRAGLVEGATQYEWSSHKAYLSKAKKWNWLHKTFILSMLEADSKKQLNKYRRFMKTEEDDHLLRLLSSKKLPSILGDSHFIESVKSRFFENKNHIEVPESKNLAPDIDQIKVAVCNFYGIDTEQLYISKRAFFNEARAVCIYLLRYLRGESLNTIGEAFGIQSYSTVSSILERFKLQLKKDNALNKKLEHIRKVLMSQE